MYRKQYNKFLTTLGINNKLKQNLQKVALFVCKDYVNFSQTSSVSELKWMSNIYFMIHSIHYFVSSPLVIQWTTMLHYLFQTSWNPSLCKASASPSINSLHIIKEDNFITVLWLDIKDLLSLVHVLKNKDWNFSFLLQCHFTVYQT